MDSFRITNRANQLNPNNPAYRGGTVTHGYTSQKSYLDNRANQLNPNNPAYWKSRTDTSLGSGANTGWTCSLL